MRVRPRQAGMALGVLSGLMTAFATPAAVQQPTSVHGERAASPVSTPYGRPGLDYKAHQVLVTFRHRITKASVDSVESYVSSMGGRMGEEVTGLGNTHKVELADGKSVAQAVRDYRNNRNVASVQPNYIYHAMAKKKMPNDPEFGQQWALHNTGQSYDSDDEDEGHIVGTPGADIDAPGAWAIRTDCSNIPVAVIDAGVNYTHADLAANMWNGNAHHGYDFVDNDADPMPVDGNEHGTHVAGIIAAVGNNNTAVTGVCWQASIMSVRVLGPDENNPSPDEGATSTVVPGIYWAVDHGARVINMSLGSQPGDSPDLLEKKALQYAGKNGVLVIVSAGNVGNNVDKKATVEYPCGFDLDNVICVAALNQKYQLAKYSNYGKKSVDVGAPGSDILSTYPGPVVSPDEYADLSTWHLGKGWAVRDCLNAEPPQVMTNPKNWCNGGKYKKHQDSVAYQTFDLSDPEILGARYVYDVNGMALAHETRFQSKHYAGSKPVNPFKKAAGTMDYPTAGEGALDECLGKQCSIGFRLISGDSRGKGVALSDFYIEKVINGTKATKMETGTSMATPYVTGIAALTWSIIPNKDYQLIRSIVLSSGDPIGSLKGKTVTGQAANALGAVKMATSFVEPDSGNGGGCTMGSPDAPFDPGFPLLLLVAVAFVMSRRRRGRNLSTRGVTRIGGIS